MLTIETISSMRNEENFKVMYDLCLKETKKLHFIKDPVLKRKKKLKLHVAKLLCRGIQEYIRSILRQRFYQAIDVLIFSVRDHFDQPSFLASEQLEPLLLKALKSEDTSTKMECVREVW